MMKLKLAAVFFGITFLLSGCEVTGPKVKVGVPIAVKVEGAKCPPGQAKKGNC